MFPTLHFQVHSASISASSTADRTCFECSFEDIVQRLQQLPLLYFEGDGSFFWTNSKEGWKLWGMLYDRMLQGDAGIQSRLQYAEIQGEFPLQAWFSVLRCIRDETEPVTEPIRIVLLPEMKACSEAEFAQTWN